MTVPPGASLPDIWSGAMRRWLLRARRSRLSGSPRSLAGVVLGEFALQRGRLPGGASRRARPGRGGRAARTAPGSSRSASTAADGVAARRLAVHARSRAARGTVLVTHGSGGSRDHATPYAAFLLDAGFDVLAPDARGHGESGGLRHLRRPRGRRPAALGGVDPRAARPAAASTRWARRWAARTC